MSYTTFLRPVGAFLAAAVAISPVTAVCNPPKSVSTYNFATYHWSYWHTSLPQGATTLVGKIWSGGTDHTGTCNEVSPGILYFGLAPGDIGVNISLGDACVVGCPSGSLTLEATAYDAGHSETLIAKAVETPAGAVHFDFSETGARALGPYRIRGTSSSRGSLTLAVDPISVFDGAEPDITGFNILTASASSDPGRRASAYTFVLFIPSPGGTGGTATIQMPCAPDPYDRFIVSQVVTTAGPSDIVSGAVRVSCRILAEPHPPRKPMSIGTER